MEDKPRIDRLGNDGAPLSVEFGQLEEDSVESATCLSRLNDGGIAFRKTCPSKRITDILGGSEQSDQSLQAVVD